MKLVYAWIEKFRNIEQQGVVIDTEFTIEIKGLDQGCRIGHDSRKIYEREFCFSENQKYVKSVKLPISSITTLAGENAAGKTSILECLQTRTDQFTYHNQEERYFLLVYYNKERESLVIRTRDIWISNAGYKRDDYRKTKGYEEYVIALEGKSRKSTTRKDITHMASFYTDRKAKTQSTYMVMGVPTIPVNIELLNARNSFVGMFEYFCSFLEFTESDNKFVFHLRDEASKDRVDYFVQDNISSWQYKNFFIYKICSLLFEELRKFLYRPEPRYMANGDRDIPCNQEKLNEEYLESMEIVSFCNVGFPKVGAAPITVINNGGVSKADVQAAIKFFRNSTYNGAGKKAYDYYIDAMEKLLSILFDMDESLFAAFYKMEIPLKIEYRDLILAIEGCVLTTLGNKDLNKSLIVDFEWLSAGEYQCAILFSGIYKRLTKTYDGFDNRDLILIFDEPEMHMHPQFSKKFIENLSMTLKGLKRSGLVRNCQIIMATHSPFIVQELSGYNNTIALVEKKNQKIHIESFKNINQLFLPQRKTYSFNLVMYHVFGTPTVELHNELYGILQNCTECFYESDMEKWLAKWDITKTKKWRMLKKNVLQPEQDVTLQTYIRNSIHHPENEFNDNYTKEEFVLSIEQMIELSELLK